MNFINRAKVHFQKRIAEWLFAAIMTTLGMKMLETPLLFEVNPIFREFRLWITPLQFALICIFMGLSRAVILLINGMWRASPHLRAACGFAGAFFWLQMCFGIAYSPQVAVAASIWPWFILLEILTVFWAMSDARSADDSARNLKTKDVAYGAGRDNEPRTDSGSRRTSEYQDNN